MDPTAFSDAGFRLMLLDLSPHYYPDARSDYGSDSAEYIFHAGWTHQCDSPDTAVRIIKEHAADAWFFPLHQTYTAFDDETWLYHAFRKYRCEYVIKDIDYLPVMAEFALDTGFTPLRYTLNRIRYNLKHLSSPKQLWRARGLLLTGLISRGWYFPGPGFCFGAGLISLGLMKKIYPAARIVSIPSADYVKVQRLLSAGAPASDLPKTPFIAYIDQCPFADPDAALFKQPLMSKAEYLGRMNPFFDRIEQAMQMKVVIAASIKYRYQGDEFDGRTVYHGRTPELCYHAHLTIAHSSTAVSLPVMMEKQILFLSIRGLIDMNHQTHGMASALGKTVLDSEAAFDRDSLTELATVDRDRYRTYVRNYLADRPFTESIGSIIARTLQEYAKAA